MQQRKQITTLILLNNKIIRQEMNDVSNTTGTEIVPLRNIISVHPTGQQDIDIGYMGVWRLGVIDIMAGMKVGFATLTCSLNLWLMQFNMVCIFGTYSVKMQAYNIISKQINNYLFPIITFFWFFVTDIQSDTANSRTKHLLYSSLITAFTNTNDTHK